MSSRMTFCQSTKNFSRPSPRAKVLRKGELVRSILGPGGPARPEGEQIRMSTSQRATLPELPVLEQPDIPAQVSGRHIHECLGQFAVRARRNHRFPVDLPRACPAPRRANEVARGLWATGRAASGLARGLSLVQSEGGYAFDLFDPRDRPCDGRAAGRALGGLDVRDDGAQGARSVAAGVATVAGVFGRRTVGPRWRGGDAAGLWEIRGPA